MPDQQTSDFYAVHADELASGYESADVSVTHALLNKYLQQSSKILELGCGSGRDAAWLTGQGHTVTAVDASQAMLDQAIKYHPELEGHTVCTPLPFDQKNPIFTNQYDAIVSIATLMHIPDQDLFECATQFRQLLKPNGTLILSTSIREKPQDDRDSNGRLMLERSPDELRLLFERLGFRFINDHVVEDGMGRPVEWHVLVFELGEEIGSRSLDHIETIINRDNKDATYKIALLRALCDVAQTEQMKIKWNSDSTVSVPLALVAEKWLYYYWPLIEPDIGMNRVIIPQKNGLETTKQIAFRPQVKALVEAYHSHGGLRRFHEDFKSCKAPESLKPLIDTALNKIASTIVTMPIKYAGGSIESDSPYFGFTGRKQAMHKCHSPHLMLDALGDILVPAGAWREMSLIGHWVSESLILRWAELSHRFSKQTVPVSRVVDLLMIKPVNERDVDVARLIYSKQSQVECVWTGAGIKAFAVDHAIPYSLWFNNDLWNLFPAKPSVNGSKSDRLVTKDTLLDSRDRIVHYWELARDAYTDRFDMEAGRSLIRGKVDSSNWKAPLFSGLVENIETLAIQRGLRRWPQQ